ncbi:MAG: DUF2029 domain-containing protein [Candidatus Omnitrophica bacterium]|nr:DUF2029 domain-containing protein [Candidatus Omnitrophota bacterium]
MIIFWNSGRIKRFSFAFVFALLIAIPIGYFFYPEQTKSLREGDFPAFYSAAVIVREGLGHQLYDVKLQRDIQNQHWPDPVSGVLYFAYPPYFALILSPLALFPPQTAKWVCAFFMALFLALAIRITSKFAPIVKENPFAAAACCLGCAPIYVSLFAGQNTPLSMLCYALAVWSIGLGNSGGDYACGLVLGLWLFKPQFPLILIFLLLLSRSWRVIAGFLFIAILYYMMGVATSGPHWPINWYSSAQWFAEQDFYFNQNRMISIHGFLRAVGSWLHLRPSIAMLVNFAGYGASAVLLSWLGALFWKAGRLKDIEIKKEKLQFLLCLSGPAMLLVSPHTLFYDLGIVCISLAGYLHLNSDAKKWIFLIGMTGIACFTLLRESVPFQPLFIVLLTALGYLSAYLRRRQVAPPGDVW